MFAQESVKVEMDMCDNDCFNSCYHGCYTTCNAGCRSNEGGGCTVL